MWCTLTTGLAQVGSAQSGLPSPRKLSRKNSEQCASLKKQNMVAWRIHYILLQHILQWCRKPWLGHDPYMVATNVAVGFEQIRWEPGTPRSGWTVQTVYEQTTRTNKVTSTSLMKAYYTVAYWSRKFSLLLQYPRYYSYDILRSTVPSLSYGTVTKLTAP